MSAHESCWLAVRSLSIVTTNLNLMNLHQTHFITPLCERTPLPPSTASAILAALREQLQIRSSRTRHPEWVFFVQSKATGQLLGRARLVDYFELSADTFWSVWLLMWKEVESARNADSVKSGCALQPTFPA